MVRPVDLAKHIAAGEQAWRIMYRHESHWANLPTSEREAALQKALESTTADQIKAEDEVERLRGGLVAVAALKPVIGGDPVAVQMAKIARDTLSHEQSQKTEETR